MLVGVPCHSEEVGKSATTAKVVQFFHEDYPPYVYRENGRVVGKIAELTELLLAKSGLKVRWRQTNYSRLIREVEFGEKPACAAGYSVRHQSRFDILRSRPVAWFPGAAIAIRRDDLKLFERHRSIKSIMTDPVLRGAFLMDVNYQGITAALIEGGAGRHILIGGSDQDLALLVSRGRVHFVPINPAQTSHMRRANPAASNLVAYKPEGMRPPRQVGIICSKKIDGEVWSLIEQSIPPLAPYDEWVSSQ